MSLLYDYKLIWICYVPFSYNGDHFLVFFSTLIWLVMFFSFFPPILTHFACIYSDSGETCAMKEVTLFSDDAKSRESEKQLVQVSSLVLEICVDPLCINFRSSSERFAFTFVLGNSSSKSAATSKYCAVLWMWYGTCYVYFHKLPFYAAKFQITI